MSIKELAYDIVDHLTEEQLKGFIMMFRGFAAVETPSEELAEALKEVEDMKKNPDKYKGYSDVHEMMRDILE